jgi:hypothetical protein
LDGLFLKFLEGFNTVIANNLQTDSVLLFLEFRDDVERHLHDTLLCDIINRLECYSFIIANQAEYILKVVVV